MADTEEITNLEDASDEQLTALLSGEESPEIPEVPETEDSEDVSAESDESADSEDDEDTGEAAEPEDEEDEADESETTAEALDYAALVESGATVDIDGQVHKLDDLMFRQRDYQKGKQELAEQRKALDADRAESNKVFNEHEQFLERLRTDNMGLAVDSIAVTHPEVAAEVRSLLERETGYSSTEARAARAEARLEQREEADKDRETGASSAALESDARKSVEAGLKRSVSDEEWEAAKSFVPAAIHKYGRVEDIITKAYEMAYPQAKPKAKKKKPKTERPAGGKTGSGTLEGKTDAEMAKMLDELG